MTLRIPSGVPDLAVWPRHMSIALGELGVTERPGRADNPRILEYLRATRLTEAAIKDSTNWCSAFVCWVLERAGLRNPGFAMARRYLTYGEPLQTPEFGCLAIFGRPPDENAGHVTFFVDQLGHDIEGLGGNQRGDSVCFATYPLERLLGYRRVPLD